MNIVKEWCDTIKIWIRDRTKYLYVGLTTKKIGVGVGRMSLYVDKQRKNRTLEGEKKTCGLIKPS